jgi:heptosyltransferase-2
MTEEFMKIEPNLQPRYRYAKRRYRLFFGLLDALCAVPFRSLRPSKPAAPEPRSILIVQLDHIGDAVLTTPMLRAIKERFPNATIDVLASESNQAIFRSSRWVNRVHVSARNWHERRSGRQSWLGELLRLGRLIRPCGYDLGIDPRGDFFVILLLWLAAIPRRLGWTCGGGGFLLTDTAPWNARRHELGARQALLAALRIRTDSARFQPELTPSWVDTYAVRELLHDSLRPKTPLVVMHIGAGTPAKRWPVAHWCNLADWLREEPGGSIILVGDTSDRSRARRIAAGRPHVADWTGRLTLMQFAALVREADLFVGCDSGPSHIAAALAVPSVVLFSGTNHWECWRPAGTGVCLLRQPVSCAPCHCKRCPVPGHPCMSGISAGAVWAAACNMLRSSSLRPRSLVS